MNAQRNRISSNPVDAVVRSKAAAAIDEFEGALESVVDESTPAAIEELRTVTNRLMVALAFILIAIE